MTFLEQSTRDFKSAHDRFITAFKNGDIKDILNKLYTLEYRAEELLNQPGVHFNGVQGQLHYCRNLVRREYNCV